MRPIRTFSILLIISLILPAFKTLSQKSPESFPVKRLTVSQAGFGWGYHRSDFYFGTPEQFSLLFPGSEILQENFNDFLQQQTYFSFWHYPNWVASFELGVSISDKGRNNYLKNSVFRAGISFSGGNILLCSSEKENTYIIDSFYDPTTGWLKYVDSVRYSVISIDHAMEQLSLDVASIFRTNPHRRISLYSGAGLLTGIPVISETRIWYSEGYHINTRSSNGHITGNHPRPGAREKSLEEEFQRSRYFTIMPYIPAGVNFRMGNRNKLLQQIHLFYEQVNGVNITTVPGGENFTSHRRQHSIGIRVIWI